MIINKKLAALTLCLATFNSNCLEEKKLNHTQIGILTTIASNAAQAAIDAIMDRIHSTEHTMISKDDATELLQETATNLTQGSTFELNGKTYCIEEVETVKATASEKEEVQEEESSNDEVKSEEKLNDASETFSEEDVLSKDLHLDDETVMTDENKENDDYNNVYNLIKSVLKQESYDVISFKINDTITQAPVITHEEFSAILKVLLGDEQANKIDITDGVVRVGHEDNAIYFSIKASEKNNDNSQE